MDPADWRIQVLTATVAIVTAILCFWAIAEVTGEGLDVQAMIPGTVAFMIGYVVIRLVTKRRR